MTHLSGYDTEFVDLPQELQYDCSICLSILRDPQLFNCCGMSFCEGCIKPLLAERKLKCPLCKGDPKPVVPDKRLQRALNQREVYCSKKKTGCEWKGLLADFDKHLNLPPTPDLRLEGCPHVILKCLYCSEDYQRGELADHENKCPQRPYKCGYCKNFTATKSELSAKHYGVCPNYPIPCTNECGEKFARCRLDSHLINDCPLTTVNCDYHYAGCEAWLMRRDLSDHLTKHAKRHANLLATENTLLFVDISRLQHDLHSVQRNLHGVVSENLNCIEMNESLLQEQDKLLKKTHEDENELSIISHHLNEKEAEVNQLEAKLKETKEKAAKASEEHKKALDQCKRKDTALKTHTSAIKGYMEQISTLHLERDAMSLELAKKESLLDRFERKNTSLETRLVKQETQISKMSEEMKALKAEREEELKAVKFELERKTMLVSEQEKQLEKLKNSPIRPRQLQGGEEWPDPDEFNPYQDAGGDSFAPYNTYHEHRVNSELSKPLPDDKEAVKDSEWTQTSSKKTKPKKLAASKGVPMGAIPAVGRDDGTAPIPCQQPQPTSIPSTSSKPAAPMSFSAALMKSPKPKPSPNATTPRVNRSRNSSSSSLTRSPLLETPKKQCKLMIRNTPSYGRGVTDDDIKQLFKQFGRVLRIDRKGSNTAVVYDNMKSVTSAVVDSDLRKLVCGGVVLNCTYEKKEKK